MRARKHITIRRRAVPAPFTSSHLVIPALLPTFGVALMLIGLGVPEGLIFTAAALTLTGTMVTLYCLSYWK
jgi:hypothetical protein